MNYEYLEGRVLDWASEKGILIESPDQAIKQSQKMVEEVEEFVKELIAVKEQHDNPEKCDDHYYKSEMELGDVMVTVIVTAYCAGLDPLISLGRALDKITKRKGKVVNGIFVKD